MLNEIKKTAVFGQDCLTRFDGQKDFKCEQLIERISDCFINIKLICDKADDQLGRRLANDVQCAIDGAMANFHGKSIMYAIKSLADEAIALQNKNRMDEVLREISSMCDCDADITSSAAMVAADQAKETADYGAQYKVPQDVADDMIGKPKAASTNRNGAKNVE